MISIAGRSFGLAVYISPAVSSDPVESVEIGQPCHGEASTVSFLLSAVRADVRHEIPTPPSARGETEPLKHTLHTDIHHYHMYATTRAFLYL